MNKNRIRGLRWRASEPMIAKPISIKLTGGKSGGCATKAGRTYLGRSAACHGIVTEGEAIHLSHVAEVSKGRNTPRGDQFHPRDVPSCPNTFWVKLRMLSMSRGALPKGQIAWHSRIMFDGRLYQRSLRTRNKDTATKLEAVFRTSLIKRRVRHR
jgi:hypothetical protein